MRLRTRVCAASATLALTGLPFATTSALADGTGDASESTAVASADDDPATDTVDGTITPGATTTLTTHSDTPEEVASPEGEEPPEQDEDSKIPAEETPDYKADDAPNDPEVTEELEQSPEEHEASGEAKDEGSTNSTSPDADPQGGKITTRESGTPTKPGGTDDPTVTSTETETETETATETETETETDGSATCDGGSDDTEGDTSAEEPKRTVRGALVPRPIAQQSTAAKPQKSQSPTPSNDNDGDASDCPCNCPTTPGDDSTDNGDSDDASETPTGEQTTDEGDDTSTGGGSGETADDEKTTPAPDQGSTPTASPSATPEMSEPSTPAQPAPEPKRRAQPLPAPPPSEEPEPTAEPAPEPTPEAPSETPVEEPETTAESSTTEETEVAGVGTEEPSTPAPQAAQPTSSGDGGPVVRLFNAISDDSSTAFGQMRQVLIAALAIGFLTTAGFVGATWHSRRSNHRR
ncbi:hypothetical protein [Brachybacterium sp. GU-2]|uniref:hypothetical protein n=1 Tax=Brachybacterium sp. GU-2 TaxID=3069708 RepID=UPI00280ACE0F|nr:hypothetical protein [Brachybacterium sp. GU-2]WME23385.1 hypothetical protein RBL05_01165 [Brachybacterium sp. GU-2]